MVAGWVINELPKWIVFGTWFLLNIILFIYQFNLFQTSNVHFYIRLYIREALAFARGPALPINFNIILILLPVCRNIISVIRGCTKVVPRSVRRILDKNLTFHKAIAWMLVVSSAMHVLAHYYNYERLTRYSDRVNVPGGFQYNVPPEALPGAGTLGALNPIQVCFMTFAGVTGHIITLALFLMITSSLEFIRRSYFEVFWYTHHLFLVFLVGLGIHQYGRLLPTLVNSTVPEPGFEFCAYRPADPFPNSTLNCSSLVFRPAGPTSWIYMLCGLLIYGLERILRVIRSFYSVIIIKVVEHPSKTFEIQMRRKGFHADAGQYVFLNCPAVAWFEWHPFTLTSSPEEDYFSVHIRIVGDWTQGLGEAMGIGKGDFQQAWELPKMYVDGPFGTASEDVFEHEVGLLVGAGIGVTPFASILKSVYYQLTEESKGLRLKKVYFYWICPEPNSFEWFADLMLNLERQMSERGISDFLDTHIYLSRGWKDNQAFFIMLREGDDRDAITGLQAKTHFGRPEWPKIFDSISLAHPNTDVGVFFCGPPVLSHNLHRNCNKYTSSGDETRARFFYNKENF